MTATTPHRIFLSDLHLDDATSPAFQTFVRCLHAEQERVDEIYLLGDLVEAWVGDDENTAWADVLRETLYTVGHSADVYLMHGNRDFLIGKAFCEQTGVTLLDEIVQLDDGTLLCHGDQLCTDDVAYQTLRKQLRGAEWKTDFLHKPLSERQQIANAMRAESQTAQANKADNIMDASEEAIDALMRRYSASLLIHGHTHRPGSYRLQSLSANRQRIVLGSWENCGWLCRQNHGPGRKVARDSVSLECFSLAHRYEI